MAMRLVLLCALACASRSASEASRAHEGPRPRGDPAGELAGWLRGPPELTVYAAAKAFARIFAEGLWLELQPHGVDVLHLVLGVTRIPAMERAGLRFDLPGLQVDDPDEVAATGLDQLATDRCS